MNGTPVLIGSIHVQTPTQLAEKAIDAIARLRRVQNGKSLRYEVGLDLAGRVNVDRPDMTPLGELLMTCTYQSDPDDLADAIRFEREQRDGKPARRVVRGRRAA